MPSSEEKKCSFCGDIKKIEYSGGVVRCSKWEACSSQCARLLSLEDEKHRPPKCKGDCLNYACSPSPSAGGEGLDKTPSSSTEPENVVDDLDKDLDLIIAQACPFTVLKSYEDADFKGMKKSIRSILARREAEARKEGFDEGVGLIMKSVDDIVKLREAARAELERIEKGSGN